LLHISTRGEAPAVGFTEAMLTGLAADGGLYMPERWPALPPDQIAGFAGQPYAEVAKAVLGLLADDVPKAALEAMIESAYAGFAHPAVCPLVQLSDNLFLLELFRGPTLSFKDVAMQLLGRLMDHVLESRGAEATIVVATSGDTGSAAVEAFAGLSRIDLFVLYPHGRVSEVQRRQMTTPTAGNVHALAIEGTFDDCQDLAKAMFNHARFRSELRLSGVNSINWARVAAQAVYYVTSAVALGAPHRPVSFSVPTGNFGDVLAGDVARRMGLPVRALMVASNENDILPRTVASGEHALRPVKATASPSMDIQISSNFERLLFELHGRDPQAVRRLMGALRQSGAFTLDEGPLARLRAGFRARAVDEGTCADEMARVYRETGLLIDPHTAIGVRAARDLLAGEPGVPTVALATAHAAKFPDAVAAATGVRPALPPHLANLMERPERIERLPNDQGAVEGFIRARARAAEGAAA
jgi:threonine synthase